MGEGDTDITADLERWLSIATRESSEGEDASGEGEETPHEEASTEAEERTVEPRFEGEQWPQPPSAPEEPVDQAPSEPQPPVEETPPAPEPRVNQAPSEPQPPVEETPPAPEPRVEETPPAPEPPVEEAPPAPEPRVEETPPAPEPPVEDVGAAPERREDAEDEFERVADYTPAAAAFPTDAPSAPGGSVLGQALNRATALMEERERLDAMLRDEIRAGVRNLETDAELLEETLRGPLHGILDDELPLDILSKVTTALKKLSERF